MSGSESTAVSRPSRKRQRLLANDSPSSRADSRAELESQGDVSEQETESLEGEVSWRRSLAKTVREEVSAEQTPLERLLDQSDRYTALMLAQSRKAVSAPVKEQESKKRKGSSTTVNGFPESQGSSSNGKKTRSARRRARSKAGEDEDDLIMGAEDGESGVRSLTRLAVQPPLLTGGTLKPYQLEGLNWLIHLHESGLNGILADEMGLGKTVQTIALLAYLKEKEQELHLPSRRHLILAPKSTLGNWENEIQRFCPALKTFRFGGGREEREEAKAQGYLSIPPDPPHPKRARKTRDQNSPSDWDVLITSYELCLREAPALRKLHFDYLVVDEAHRIKNEASKLSRVVRLLKTNYRLLLTGTPLQNNLKELWALLNFLFPEMFASSEEFDRLFDLTGALDSENNPLSPEERTERNAGIVSRLHKVLRPFLLRRTKAEVMYDLPPKKELLLYIPLSQMQRSLYRDLLARNVDALYESQSGGGRVRLLNLAMQLRKACNHPYLFEGCEDRSWDPCGEHIVENAGKLRLVDKLLQRLKDQESRVLIFTQMTRMMDILEDYCRIRSYEYCRLDGGTSGEDRESQLEEFNAPESPKFVFLLSTRAGGLGINLATADTVILYDSDWNPQVDLQAMDRAHRIGQRKPVTVYRLIHENTIEVKVIERAMLKLKLDTAVIQHGRLCARQQQLSKNELMRMIQFGAEQLYKDTSDTKPANVNGEDGEAAKSSEIAEGASQEGGGGGAGKSGTSKTHSSDNDFDIDQILSRGQERSQQLAGSLDSHLQTNLLNFDFSAPNLYEFEGVNYDSSQKHADRQAWNELGMTKMEEERAARRRARAAQEEAEAESRRELLVAAGVVPPTPPDRSAKSKFLRVPRMEEWQFYDRTRIAELQAKEVTYSATRGGTDEPSAEERQEKQSLLSEGFHNWNRKDFLNFVRACETFGSSDTLAVAREVGKDVASVEKYLKVFLQRYAEITDGERFLKRVKSGDDVSVRKRTFEILLNRKLADIKHPWHRLAWKFSKSKTHFTDEEDHWLLNAVRTVGYGNWEDLHNLVNEGGLGSEFSLNWFMRTRTAQDLARRVDVLLKQMQREAQNQTANTRSRTAREDAQQQALFSDTPGQSQESEAHSSENDASFEKIKSIRTKRRLYPSEEEMYGRTIIPSPLLMRVASEVAGGAARARGGQSKRGKPAQPRARKSAAGKSRQPQSEALVSSESHTADGSATLISATTVEVEVPLAPPSPELTETHLVTPSVPSTPEPSPSHPVSLKSTLGTPSCASAVESTPSSPLSSPLADRIPA